MTDHATLASLAAGTDPTQGLTRTILGVPCLVEIWTTDHGRVHVALATIEGDRCTSVVVDGSETLVDAINHALAHGDPMSWPAFGA